MKVISFPYGWKFDDCRGNCRRDYLKKQGYLSQKKSKGKTYIYLRRTHRIEKKITHEYLYSFGSMPRALERMYWLRDNPESFPKELREKGYDLMDLYEWIMTIETKITSTGRNFNI